MRMYTTIDDRVLCECCTDDEELDSQIRQPTEECSCCAYDPTIKRCEKCETPTKTLQDPFEDDTYEICPKCEGEIEYEDDKKIVYEYDDAYGQPRLATILK